MNLYFTDAIGVHKPGSAFIKAASRAEAISKVLGFIRDYPQYRLFKTPEGARNYLSIVQVTQHERIFSRADIAEFVDVDVVDHGDGPACVRSGTA